MRRDGGPSIVGSGNAALLSLPVDGEHIRGPRRRWQLAQLSTLLSPPTMQVV